MEIESCSILSKEERIMRIEKRYGNDLPMILTLLRIKKESPEFFNIEETIANTLTIVKGYSG